MLLTHFVSSKNGISTFSFTFESLSTNTNNQGILCHNTTYDREVTEKKSEAVPNIIDCKITAVSAKTVTEDIMQLLVEVWQNE